MHVGAGLPVARMDDPREFLTGDAIAEIAQAAERAGFDTLSVSEHPFPDDDWLTRGNGHHNHDPFVALSFAAAATKTIKLRTSLLILPYRNPFITARAAASLDALSGGRLVLGVGAGYLEAEFKALGVDFGERNELSDEAIIAMRRAWTEDGVHMKGRHFDAQGHTMAPRPAQKGGPPIWIGGNSKLAIHRAVELGDGWMPMRYEGNIVSRRTAELASLEDFRARLGYASEHARRIGRTQPLGVSFGLQLFSIPDACEGADGFIDAAHYLAALGVTDTGIGAAPTSRAAYIGELERIGAELLPRLHAIHSPGLAFV
ncbi:MAG: TIGR03619 family F420-dependent LLM class oxidoreductase [Caulobacterales bacterium]